MHSVLDRNIQDPLSYGILNGLSVIGSQEALPPSDASGYGLAVFLSTSEQGLYYPSIHHNKSSTTPESSKVVVVNGYDLLLNTCIQAIRSIGGEVYSNVPIDEIEVYSDENDSTDASTKTKSASRTVTGVKTMFKSSKLAEHSSIIFKCYKSVISGVGVISTFTKLLPTSFVSSNMRNKLTALQETRPKIHILYVLKDGVTSLDVGLKSTEYYEINSDYNSIQWIATKANGDNKLENTVDDHKSSKSNHKGVANDLIHASYCRIACPSVQNPNWDANNTVNQTILVEFELNDNVVSLKPFNYSDTSSNQSIDGPKVYSSSNINKSDPYALGQEISLNLAQIDRIKAYADSKLKSVYPLLFATSDLIKSKHVVLPRVGGFGISSTPAKYGAKLTSHTDIQVSDC